MNKYLFLQHIAVQFFDQKSRLLYVNRSKGLEIKDGSRKE